MKTLGEAITQARLKKRISLLRAAKDLRIKKQHLEALEQGNWQKLPEPPFVQGFLKSYAAYLNLDENLILALWRREFDQSAYPKKTYILKEPKGLLLSTQRLRSITVILTILVLGIYFAMQYLSILSSPKLEVFSPAKDQTVSVPVVEVSGQTEAETTVSVEGTFVSVDAEGDFTHQINLEKGQNIIEIIASKRLSPKTKITRTVRLIE